MVLGILLLLIILYFAVRNVFVGNQRLRLINEFHNLELERLNAMFEEDPNFQWNTRDFNDYVYGYEHMLFMRPFSWSHAAFIKRPFDQL